MARLTLRREIFGTSESEDELPEFDHSEDVGNGK